MHTVDFQNLIVLEYFIQSWMFVLLMMPHVGPVIRQYNIFYSILYNILYYLYVLDVLNMTHIHICVCYVNKNILLIIIPVKMYCFITKMLTKVQSKKTLEIVIYPIICLVFCTNTYRGTMAKGRVPCKSGEGLFLMSMSNSTTTGVTNDQPFGHLT